MSRIGKKSIQIPEGVTVETESNSVKVTGPKGTLVQRIPADVVVNKEDGQIKVSLKRKSNQNAALYGTVRALIANMVSGVTKGWSKTLELVGAGYRGDVSGDTLTLLVGYSHPIKVKAPQGISFKIEKTIITVDGPDKELVGQIAADIRSIRPPEPYKGKGIKYQDEIIRKKAGKAAKTAGAA